jgi:hypothetical protein
MGACAMTCDICAGSGGGNVLGPQQVRDAVSRGFNPFGLGLFPSQLFAASSQTPDSAFRQWRVMVNQNQTDWDLCPSCFNGIKPYLSGPPKPTGITGPESFSSSRQGSGGGWLFFLVVIVAAVAAYYFFFRN